MLGNPHGTFRPRGGSSTRPRWVTWKEALPHGYGRTGWALTATASTRLTTSARGILVKLGRRLTRKVARLTVTAPVGRPWSTKPVGTRMGKGKGKTADRIGWLPQGATALMVVAHPVAAARLRPLTRRDGRWRLISTWW